jgi:hypothetical protein
MYNHPLLKNLKFYIDFHEDLWNLISSGKKEIIVHIRQDCIVTFVIQLNDFKNPVRLSEIFHPNQSLVKGFDHITLIVGCDVMKNFTLKTVTIRNFCEEVCRFLQRNVFNRKIMYEQYYLTLVCDNSRNDDFIGLY